MIYETVSQNPGKDLLMFTVYYKGHKKGSDKQADDEKHSEGSLA